MKKITRIVLAVLTVVNFVLPNDLSAQNEANTTSGFHAGVNRVNFVTKTMGGKLNLVGDLYLPPNFDDSKTYPTIVFTGPILQVKEQMAAVYGKKFSKIGYVFLAFDHAGFGDSEGEIRGLDDVATKINDVQNAVSYLRTLPFVDRTKFYGIGGCMGANTMAYAALTDKRIKKIAVVSGMLANSIVFQFDKEIDQKMVDASKAMQKFYETDDVGLTDLANMDEAKDSKRQSMREGYDYYMTERGGTQTYPNYSHMGSELTNLSFPRYDASKIAKYLKMPVITVYGTDAETKIISWLMFHRKLKKPKKKLKIKGASHVDLYDKDEYVDQAVNGIDKFFLDN